MLSQSQGIIVRQYGSVGLDPFCPLVAMARFHLLQVEPQPHFVAIAGIVALALLGGVLVIRNKLDRYADSTVTESSQSDAFVSDRERVRQLVQKNGGRMKQSAIVESVDWSKAKVSRLLAALEDEGEITKLRIGRENLICLRGHEPPASKSSGGSKGE